MGWGMGARIAIALAVAGPAYAQARTQAWANEPINGRWAIDPEGCKIEGDTTETAPLYITDKTYKWWTSACKVGKSYKVGHALYIQGRCSGEGERFTMKVKFDLVSRDKLFVTWDGAKPVEMRRCK